MKFIVRYVIVEAVKDLLQPTLQLLAQEKHLKFFHGIINTSIIIE